MAANNNRNAQSLKTFGSVVDPEIFSVTFNDTHRSENSTRDTDQNLRRSITGTHALLHWIQFILKTYFPQFAIFLHSDSFHKEDFEDGHVLILLIAHFVSVPYSETEILESFKKPNKEISRKLLTTALLQAHLQLDLEEAITADDVMKVNKSGGEIVLSWLSQFYWAAQKAQIRANRPVLAHKRSARTIGEDDSKMSQQVTVPVLDESTKTSQASFLTDFPRFSWAAEKEIIQNQSHPEDPLSAETVLRHESISRDYSEQGDSPISGYLPSTNLRESPYTLAPKSLTASNSSSVSSPYSDPPVPNNSVASDSPILSSRNQYAFSPKELTQNHSHYQLSPSLKSSSEPSTSHTTTTSLPKTDNNTESNHENNNNANNNENNNNEKNNENNNNEKNNNEKNNNEKNNNEKNNNEKNNNEKNNNEKNNNENNHNNTKNENNSFAKTRMQGSLADLPKRFSRVYNKSELPTQGLADPDEIEPQYTTFSALKKNGSKQNSSSSLAGPSVKDSSPKQGIISKESVKVIVSNTSRSQLKKQSNTELDYGPLPVVLDKGTSYTTFNLIQSMDLKSDNDDNDNNPHPPPHYSTFNPDEPHDINAIFSEYPLSIQLRIDIPALKIADFELAVPKELLAAELKEYLANLCKEKCQDFPINTRVFDIGIKVNEDTVLWLVSYQTLEDNGISGVSNVIFCDRREYLTTDKKKIQIPQSGSIQGYLTKMGQKSIFPTWKRRWFHTEENVLYYFADRTKEDPIGAINLQDSQKIAVAAANPTMFEIALPERTYRLQANSSQNCLSWVTGLQKINQIYKASDSKVILKKGYLFKQGAKRRNWKKRLFVLKPQFIYYYETEMGSQHLQGKIPLLFAKIDNFEKTDKPHCFQVKTKERTFYISCATDEEKLEWMSAVKKQTEDNLEKLQKITIPDLLLL